MDANIQIKSQCVAAAASILGNKWTPLLIRALMNNTLRFCQLQEKAGGINPRTLSDRLVRLEKANIIKKITYPELPPKTEYSLTKKGEDLVPILQSMANWGEKYPKESLK